MRKWLLLFLSVLVMAASLIPCCSADNCGEDASISTSTHPEEDTDSGNCSPFFTCGSCVGFVHQIRPLSIQPLPQTTPIHQSFLTAFSAAEYVHGFFQPPRLQPVV